MKCMILKLVTAVAVCLGLSHGAHARPNVLFITIDDLNTDLGSYGHPLVKSPHIDRLARSGVRFNAAYAQYPICSPSRASFLTGLYPEQTGVVTNGVDFREIIPDVVTLPQYFRQNAYSTARVGKIYHYNVPGHIGTDGQDDPKSWDKVLNPRGIDVDYGDRVHGIGPGKIGAKLTWLTVDDPAEKHTDSLVTDGAIRLMEEMHPERTGKPFFLAVGYFRPHTPFITPRRFTNLYPLDRIKAPPSFQKDREDIPLAALSDRTGQLSMPADTMKEIIQAYYASITFVDEQVGRLLSALKKRGLGKNTIIVLLSDHGFHLGAHGLWLKGDLFEGSVRAPLIVAAPERNGNGGVAEAPVEFTDLYPTLTDLAGLETPKHVRGRSLLPVLENPRASVRSSAFSMAASRAGKTRSEYRNRSIWGYSVRTERFRYTEWGDGSFGVELYDYKTDPQELTNFAEKEGEYANARAKLSRLLRKRVEQGRKPVVFN